MLELSSINRNFGVIQALRGAEFEVRPGEVMGLVGENGAGKSTLVRIISGFDNGYTGEYRLSGRRVRFAGPGQAERAGIAIAQQELSLVPTMSVAENIFLVGDHVPVFATRHSLARRAVPFLEAVGLDHIDPATATDRMSVGEQHLVEVAKLLAHNPQILILDEPTAALGEADSQRILDMARRLAGRGKSIIYVSHRLDEIFQITDRVTVLRDGESQKPRPTAELDVDTLVEMMLGRELRNLFPGRRQVSPDRPLMEVRELWPDGMLEPVSFDIRAGEILGLAGQLGSGSGDVLAAIAGAARSRSGVLHFGDRKFLPEKPKEAIAAGIAYCSEDRKHDGLFLGRPILENLTAPALDRISRHGLLRKPAEHRLAAGNAEKFTIDVARLSDEAGVLSGGNQQKVALAKWLAVEPRVILVNEPTRGVDVGARAEIYSKLRELADSGVAVVIATTDLQEIANLPDRVLTFYRGLQIGEIGLEEMDTARILKQITHPFDRAESPSMAVS